MSRVHLRPDWGRVIGEKAAPGVRDAARAIQKTAYNSGVTVGDVDGGGHEYPLPVRIFHDDDGTSRVALAHPAGIAVQAKHGTLTRAAAANGFEVRS